MEDLAGQCKKNSGIGPPQTFTKREKVTLAVAIVHIGLILFFMSCIKKLVNWYEKVRFKPQNKFNSGQKADIIDVDYEVTNER